ncbi:MAG: hypothetical protein JW955_13915 [Sedimentisphaerales bacterium]|nr:hypothetical protein [Sedimentisphaerales bacterium]
MKRWFIHSTVLLGFLSLCSLRAAGAVEYPGPALGNTAAAIKGDEISLSNNVIICKWSIRGGRLKPISITNKHTSVTLDLQDTECFQLLLTDGQMVKASDLRIVHKPNLGRLHPDRKSPRIAAREGGRQIYVPLSSSGSGVEVRWQVSLSNGSDYMRQSVFLPYFIHGTAIREITLVQLPVAQAKPAGTVDASPAISEDMFFALEHPLAKVPTPDESGRVLQCSFARTPPKTVGSEEYSSVMGVAPKGQLRRSFLYYIERERAQPYRPFLHYNSWYDIGYGNAKILEGDALKVIDLFGNELIDSRKVTLDSFVLDDGWDNPATLWQFHEDLPNGFTPLQQAAARNHSRLGVWLSPWGGYGKSKEARMKYGQQEGFETNSRGFSMAGAKYYGRFRDACMKMIRDYDVNYFKFDGISSGGAPTGAEPEYAADVEALLRLTTELRKAKPDLFINVTTGTWSSPYWLFYADSTWRSGNDWSTCGWGSKRRQQITYRDNETYHNVVQRAPLYPINSLMTQGVMFANHGLPDEPNGLIEDIRAFFASGTNCQELYLTPSLLSAQAWDALAEAAEWSRDDADVLVDTHWIGGDPIKGEIYGWASWSKRKGIIAFRNPSDKSGTITIDIDRAFELPEGAAQKYSLKSPWKSDVSMPPVELSAGREHIFELKPFDVLVFDAMPL